MVVTDEWPMRMQLCCSPVLFCERSVECRWRGLAMVVLQQDPPVQSHLNSPTKFIPPSLCEKGLVMCRSDGTQKFTYGDLDWGLCVASSEHLVGGEVRTVLWGTAMNEREAKTLQCGCSLSSSSVVFGPPFGENVTRVVVANRTGAGFRPGALQRSIFLEGFPTFLSKNFRGNRSWYGGTSYGMVPYHTVVVRT